MNWILIVAAFPLIWRFLAPLVPPQYIEPYAYWDSASLNTAAADGRVPKWRNMGYWTTGDETFTEANAALAHKLLDFADAKLDGRTLDIAHGAGESLLLHLENGAEVDALTSLPAETAEAQSLVDAWAKANGKTPAVTWFTTSAGYRPTKDFDHPLNPMRGFMGEETLNMDRNSQVVLDADDEDYEDDEDNEDNDKDMGDDATPIPPPQEPVNTFDLVYVLDAAYHFPPAIGYFAASVLPVLRPSSGVLAYTDILPPAALSQLPLMLTAGWLAPLLSTPRRNLNERPASIGAYAEQLTGLGYEGVKVEDWTAHVFVPLAANLEKKGGLWWAYAQVLRLADRTGWKFVAVRGQAPNGAEPLVTE